MKKIMILGSSWTQVPLIKTARNGIERPNASRLLRASKEGIIREIHIPPYEEKNVQIALHVKTGDRVHPFADSSDSIGHIIAAGETVGECLSSLDAIEKALEIIY